VSAASLRSVGDLLRLKRLVGLYGRQTFEGETSLVRNERHGD
jgi:hypothetical protein